MCGIHVYACAHAASQDYMYACAHAASQDSSSGVRWLESIMDDEALLALWCCGVTDESLSASMMEQNPSPTVGEVDWDGILPLRCDRPQHGFAVFHNVRKAAARACYELLSAESQKRLVTNVPVFLSYGRASAFSGSEGCECVFEDMWEQIICKSFVACRCFRCVARDTVVAFK